MPTRQQMSRQIRQDLATRGMTPSDPMHDFVLSTLEEVNHGIADLDDELAEAAARLTWLAQAPTWANQRELDDFDSFVTGKLAECEVALAMIRDRWERHQTEPRQATASASEP